MINFYSFAPEIFILTLILISITFGILNKGATITINATGFSLLTIFLIFKGHSIYQDTLYSLNTINLILLSKIILSIGSIISSCYLEDLSKMKIYFATNIYFSFFLLFLALLYLSQVIIF